MAKFITGNALSATIERIVEEAQQKLFIVSPHIRLHHRYRDLFKVKAVDTGLNIVIVFGKKGKDFLKSFNPKDLAFFKEFPNIEIRFEERLNANYFANEKEAVLTSMSLYDSGNSYSIEAGVSMKSNLLNNLFGESVDSHSYDFFLKVVQNSEVMYKNTPEFSKGILGQMKKYKGSNVEIDKLQINRGMFDD